MSMKDSATKASMNGFAPPLNPLETSNPQMKKISLVPKVTQCA